MALDGVDVGSTVQQVVVGIAPTDPCPYPYPYPYPCPYPYPYPYPYP